jgi:GDP-L-fucose synthase
MECTSKIYVAGHTGLVGSALMRKLHSAGFKNIVTRDAYELDLRNQAAVDAFFAAEKPEYVFLAAAKVGGIGANNTYKADFIYDNIMIATNVIHAAYIYGVKKLLNLGSSCIYPKNAPQPLKEEYLLTGSLETTNEPYAIAKIAAIKLCRYYNEQYGTNFISVMPTNLYGPNDNYNLETAHVLPALIRKFHLAKLLQQNDFEAIKQDLKRYRLGFGLDEFLFASGDTTSVSVCSDSSTDSTQPLVLSLSKDSSGVRTSYPTDADIINTLAGIGITAKSVTLWGIGTPYREILYVDDLAGSVVFLMQQYDAKDIGEIINIGTGVDHTIQEIAMMIKKVIGFDGIIEFDQSKPDGTMKKLLDVSRMKKLGWQAQISSEKGITFAYHWYVQPDNKGEKLQCSPTNQF